MNPGAVVALVIAATLWGTTGTAASFFPEDVSPIAVGAATMGIGGMLLLLFAWRRALAVLRHRAQRRWVALGALGVVVYPLAFYSGMDLAGVAVGNVVALGSGPVFAALLEWLLERRPLSRRWVIATAFALLGIAALATSRYGTELGITDWLNPRVEPNRGLDPATTTWYEVRLVPSS